MCTLAEANDGYYVVLQTYIMISLISFYTFLASVAWRSDGVPYISLCHQGYHFVNSNTILRDVSLRIGEQKSN